MSRTLILSAHTKNRPTSGYQTLITSINTRLGDFEQQMQEWFSQLNGISERQIISVSTYADLAELSDKPTTAIYKVADTSRLYLYDGEQFNEANETEVVDNTLYVSALTQLNAQLTAGTLGSGTYTVIEVAARYAVTLSALPTQTRRVVQLRGVLATALNISQEAAQGILDFVASGNTWYSNGQNDDQDYNYDLTFDNITALKIQRCYMKSIVMGEHKTPVVVYDEGYEQTQAADYTETHALIVPANGTPILTNKTGWAEFKNGAWSWHYYSFEGHTHSIDEIADLEATLTTIQTQNAAIQTTGTALQDANRSITGLNQIPAFSEEAEYIKDDLVVYEGELYRFTQPKSAGAWSDNAVTHTSLYEEIQRLQGKDLYEHILLTLRFKGTPSDRQYSAPTGDDLTAVLNSVQIVAEDSAAILNRQIIDYDDSKAIELSIERGANYHIILPSVGGYYTPATRDYTAVMSDRTISIDYTARTITDYSTIADGEVGLFIVDVDGVAHDPENWVFANRDRAVAILVKTQTLIDNNACYYFKIDDFLAMVSRQWWPQNVDFPALSMRGMQATSGGLDFGGSYGDREGVIFTEDMPPVTGRPSSLTDYIIYHANTLCQQYIDTNGTSGYNLGTAKLTDRCAAAYCRYSDWTDKDTYTLRQFDPNDGAGLRTGYLGTAGQWYELWLQKENFNKLWNKLTGDNSKLLSYTWWCSTQFNDSTSLNLHAKGLLLAGNNKLVNYRVVPFYDL